MDASGNSPRFLKERELLDGHQGKHELIHSRFLGNCDGSYDGEWTDR